MNEIVAILATDVDGVVHGYLVWGRIFGAVQYEPLEQAVRRHASGNGVVLQPDCPVEAQGSLSDPRDARYFHDCLVDMQDAQLHLAGRPGPSRSGAVGGPLAGADGRRSRHLVRRRPPDTLSRIDHLGSDAP